MMNDSIREELQAKITSGRLNRPVETSVEAPVVQPNVAAAPEPIQMSAPPPIVKPVVEAPKRPLLAAPAPRRHDTAGLAVSKTSPTLVGFETKTPQVPEWRLKLQNSVKQRRGSATEHNAGLTNSQFPVVGSAALKSESVAVAEPSVINIEKLDDRAANALRRIEESRKAFQSPVVPQAKITPKHNFGVVPRSELTKEKFEPRSPIDLPKIDKPRLVDRSPIVVKRNTNKLPPITAIKPSIPVVGLDQRDVEIEQPKIERVEQLDVIHSEGEFAEVNRIHIKADPEIYENEHVEELEYDEIEDLAPLSSRFNAGLFDLIIVSFVSMLLLSPAAFALGDWFTATGLLVFAATCGVVTFAYMTLCLGLYGKTMGMRLFSLELVDAVENQYPTLRQAAISSSLYIVSMIFGGAGFLTLFVNEERRAVHDLVSGTITVREF